MANDPRVEAIYSGLSAIVASVDKAPAKERDNFAPSQMATHLNKLRDAALPFASVPDLLPDAIGQSTGSTSLCRYIDLRAYAVQIREALPYSDFAGITIG